MVSKNILGELHSLGWFVLALGIFFLAVPYLFKISDFNHILFYTIVGIIFIKLAIIFRENLRINKIF